MARLAGFITWLFVFASTLACPAIAQTIVYSNQASIGSTSYSAYTLSTEWDDLQLVGGGLLSELSLVTRHSGGGPQFASGYFDLRVFNEAFNYPQGDPLGVIPFSGTFPATSAGSYSDGVLIELTDLESLGITLPVSERIGLGVRFDQSGWGLIASGPAEIGSSPGGNWLGDSTNERNEFGNGLPYRLTVADPTPVGPGVGSYALFETALATPDDPVQNSGMIGDDGFFPGIGFRVERTTQISQVGAYMYGSGTMFAAIVETDNLFGLPDPPDLSGDDVLATTLIELPGTLDGADVVADMDVTLEPGTYALVFGTGKFGAENGNAFFRDGHVPNGDWSDYSIRQSDGLRFFQAGSHRFFATAESAPGTVQVRPTFDILAEVTEGSYPGEVESVRLVDGDASIMVDSNTLPDPDEHAVWEFSLEDVPLDRDIIGVTLELDLNLLTTSGPLAWDVLGYAGDGAAQRTDAVGPKSVVGRTTFTSIVDIVSVAIDPTFVEGLLGQASHLGLTIAPGDTGNFSFRTLESGEFGEPALLTISLGPPPDEGLTGDYNGDGVVDAADYTVWRDMLGQSGTGLAADGDGSGTVDEDDYDVWKSNYGHTDSSGTSTGGGSLATPGQVPEPGSLSLLLLGVTMVAGGAGRRQDCCRG